MRTDLLFFFDLGFPTTYLFFFLFFIFFGGGQKCVESNKHSYGKILDPIVNSYNLKTVRDNNTGYSESYIDCFMIRGIILDLVPVVLPTPRNLKWPNISKSVGMMTLNHIYPCSLQIVSWRIKWYVDHYSPPPPGGEEIDPLEQEKDK